MIYEEFKENFKGGIKEAPEDRLTDHVYHYDSEAHIFEMADKYEQRMAGKDAEKESPGKDSILDDLKAKKEKTAKEATDKAVKEAVMEGEKVSAGHV